VRRTWQLLGYLSLVFLAGIAVGVLGQRFYSLSGVSAKAPFRTPDEVRKAYVADMQSRLKLSSDQVEKLKTILDDTRAHYREFREKHAQEMKVIQDGQVDRINAMLSPDQRVEYEKFRKEREERRKAAEKGGC
jgi:hypothetical protein